MVVGGGGGEEGGGRGLFYDMLLCPLSRLLEQSRHRIVLCLFALIAPSVADIAGG